MKLKKMILTGLALVMTAAVLAGCGNTAQNDGAANGNPNAPETKKVRLALSGSAHIFNAIAEEQGYLKDEGIEVEYVTSENPSDAFTSLAAGKVDVLSNYGTNLPLQYIGAGQDLTMFAGYMLTGCMPVITRAETPWHGIEDLIGKRVAGEPSVFAVTGALLDKGYDPLHQIQWVQIENDADRVAAVISGNADYAILGTSAMFKVTHDPKVKVVGYCSDFTPDYSCCRVEANTEWVKKNPNTVKALLRAWIRAQAYFEKHKEEEVGVVADILKTDPEFVRSYMLNEHFRLNIDPYKKSIIRAWGYMDRLGLLDEKAKEINISDHINTELYKQALDECQQKYGAQDKAFYERMQETYQKNDM